MKKTLMAALALAVVLCPSLSSAQFSGCQQVIGGRSTGNEFICPPPMGDMVVDIMGNFICGPGQCAIDTNGKVKCASKPGGQSVIDSTGKAKCVGGCVDGSASACVAPTY